MSEKTEGAIKNEQYRDTGNIWVHKTQDEDNTEILATFGYTRYMTKTIQRHWQHLVHKTQDEDNPETRATFGTQDT